MRFIVSLLVFIALILSSVYWLKLIHERYEPKEKYIYQNQQVIQKEKSTEQHNEEVMVVYIPTIGKRLRVDPLNVDVTSDASKWPISSIGVSLVASTGEPGTGGNSVIFGHNWKSIFKDLHRLRVGDKVIIYRNYNDQKLFQVEKVSVVNPTDTELLANHNKNELTLYTCTDFLDSKRLVITTSFVEGLGDSRGS